MLSGVAGLIVTLTWLASTWRLNFTVTGSITRTWSDPLTRTRSACSEFTQV